MTWGSLGPHTFDIGPNTESLKLAVNIAEHPRIGRKPTQQLSSEKPQELSWTITLHRSNYDVGVTIQALQTSMQEGEILDLVHGEQPDTGAWAGQWIITDIEIEEITRVPGGHIYSANIKLTLKEWVQRENLTVSKRTPPPAVKPKTTTTTTAPAKPVSGYR